MTGLSTNGKKRIALVHPRGFNWLPGSRDVTDVANRMAPQGLLSIAACLLQEGHDVFLYDCLGPGVSPDLNVQVKTVLAYQPDLVGFSATTSSFPDAAEMAGKIKKASAAISTVCGGVHVSALMGDLLAAYPAFDFLCAGEGEDTLTELAGGKTPEEIPGLIRRQGSEVVVNPPRSPIPDLDTLPFPAYEKLKGFPKDYHLPLFSYVHTPGATMITSRGCMYSCSYCDRSVFKRGFRYNSAPYIYEHMNYLRTRFGVRHVNIYDDLFTFDRKRIVELCETLCRRPLGMNFNCAVRVGHTDDALLSMLKEAGCLMVSLGVESADPQMLARHKSGVSLEAVRDTVKRIQDAGLRAKGLFMMGLPGETEESIRKTSDFIIDLGLDDMNMAKFTPFPGAPLWPTIREEGMFEEDWRLMNCLNFVFVPRGIESRERLDQLYNGHVKRFYSDPGWRKKFRDRLWEHRHSLLYLIRHLPSFWLAKRQFEPGRSS
ncbi:B12 binding domain-containing protein [Syntrophus gentianae]|uniref:B12 binding domain-containing protein n=1 Tax=Syntrophus gentianae TaxID=43775 RepID=A0A1H7YUR6_9BACT|nr:radical SAM protein [Syntrophus gentianae]SEM49946.1 B12 binding domain-containing protein [Syntrophus gentianae]